jgi:hypothetical protein
MGYLRHEEFMELVEIVRHAPAADRMDMLCRRVVEMDQMMGWARDREANGEEIDSDDFNRQMMERWVALAECTRACNYLAREPKEEIPQVVREWLQSQVEEHVGFPVDITEFREMTQEEYNSYVQAGPIGEADVEIRANPFFQADGTTYPAQGSSRERGTPGTRTVEKSIPGASDQLSEPFLRLFRSLEKGKDSPQET